MNSSEVFSRVWAAFDAGEIVTVCAWCGRFGLDGDWFPAPPAVVDAIDARLTLSHSICSVCAEAYLPRPAAPGLLPVELNGADARSRRRSGSSSADPRTSGP